MPALELAADSILSGTYRVVRMIGRGGMGQVYEARHLRTKAKLALKILLTDGEISPEIFQRFKREAEITSDLNHPNIVRVIDFDTLPDGRPFLVMELLEGRELARLMQPGTPVPPDEVAEIVEQIARGLAAAHERGIVHRDLKPANVFLVKLPAGGGELAKLLDFGISKVHDGAVSLTGTDTIMGTPNYMSPEQARGKTGEADARTDQFALAAIAYEMLTGHQPFPGDSPLSILYRVVHEQPAPLGSWAAALPAELEAVVARGLAKSPDDRFPTIDEFARAFASAARLPGPIASTTGGAGAAAERMSTTPGPAHLTTLRASSGQMEAMTDTPVPARAPWRRRLVVMAGVVVSAVVIIGAWPGHRPSGISSAGGGQPDDSSDAHQGASSNRITGTGGSPGASNPDAGTDRSVAADWGGGRMESGGTGGRHSRTGVTGRTGGIDTKRKPEAGVSTMPEASTRQPLETRKILRNLVISGPGGSPP